MAWPRLFRANAAVRVRVLSPAVPSVEPEALAGWLRHVRDALEPVSADPVNPGWEGAEAPLQHATPTAIGQESSP